MDELNWRLGAPCAQVEPEMFFPGPGDSNRPAKLICGGCNVREQCLTYALDTAQQHGIWGWLSEKERRAPRRALGQRLEPCGTHAAYRRHRDAGEEPCAECAEANRARNRAWRANRDRRRVAA